MDSSDDEETQNAEKQNEELPEVTKERFYEVMSDSFKDAFSDKGPDLASKSFSLMSTFEGKEDSDTNDQDMFGKFFFKWISSWYYVLLHHLNTRFVVIIFHGIFAQSFWCVNNQIKIRSVTELQKFKIIRVTFQT